MALGRNPHNGAGDVRDIRGDYIRALLAEREGLLRGGHTERANEVTVELRKLGHEVDKVATGAKERAVADPDVEKAVPDENPAPKRRGRPPKGE